MDFSEAYTDTCSTIGAAARVGDVCALQTLLRQGRPVDVRDNRGWEPIHEAAYGNNTGCLQVLLHRGNVNVNVQSFAGETALLLASRKGNYQCVASLLHSGVDPNLTTPEGFSPLWEAVSAHCYQSVKLLVEKGASLETTNYTEATALHQAVDLNEIQIVIFLLKSAAKFDVVDENLLTPLFMAAQRGNYECLKVLLEKSVEAGKPHLVDSAAFDGATPLLVASQQGHTSCVELLLSYKANPNLFTTDSEPVCPLQSAIACNNLSCVKLLYNVTKTEEIRKRCSSEWYPIPLALDLSLQSILQFLLTDDVSTDMTVTYQTSSGARRVYPKTVPLLTYAVLECSEVHCIETLLQYGFPINDTRRTLMPPVIAALENMREECLELFWKYGADPNIYHPDISGNFAVLYALHNDLMIQDVTSATFTGKILQQVLRQQPEIRSCLLLHRQPTAENLTIQSISSLFEFHELNLVHFDTILNILVFMGGSFVCINETLATYIGTSDWQKVQQTNETCSSLSHLCRLKVIHMLRSRRLYQKDRIISLALPMAVQDMLLLEDTGKLQDFLMKVFELK